MNEAKKYALAFLALAASAAVILGVIKIEFEMMLG